MGYLDSAGLAHLWEKIENRSLAVKEITQAAYDAMTEEEKLASDVLWVITDGQSSGDSSSGGGIPSGCILIWSGAADAIPDGWALCDGENGTPNLRGRFVYGGQGGIATNVGEKGGSSTHKLTIQEMPKHSHELYSIYETGTRKDNAFQYQGVGLTNVRLNTSEVGGGQPFNIMPPYYVLCYIMKL